MNSAGNDIVALAAIDVTRTRQPNFYSRVITPAEQELYSAGFADLIPLEHFVWLVWSVKESAYKFLKRFDPQLVFSPSKMAVTTLTLSNGYFEGTVRSGDHVLFSRSFIRQDYIFSIVNSEESFSDIYYEIEKIDSAKSDEQSNAVRTLLLKKLDQLLPRSDLRIAKNPHGWPVIINDSEELFIPASFTHHGHFVAYSFYLDPTLWKHPAEIL